MSTESLAANLTYQLDHSAALRQFTYSAIVDEHRGEYARSDYIAMLQFYRCSQTHEAIEILVKNKLVEDARALLRVLVEHAVNCVYMLTVADAQIADDFVDYAKYKRYEDVQALKRADESMLRSFVSAEEEELLRKEFESLRPRFKDRRNDRWCVDGTLYKRAERVDARITQETEEEHTKFRWLVNSVWRSASAHVHGTADALSNQSSPVDGGITIEQKYDPEDAAHVVYSANLVIYLILPLVDQLIGGKNLEEIRLRTMKWNGDG